jgi:hypothetical protein
MNKIEKNRIPKERPTQQNLEMLQARFYGACSWTEMESSLAPT